MATEQIVAKQPLLEEDITTLAKGTGISFVGKYAGRGLHAVGQVILARLLGPDLYGLYGLGWTTLRLVGSLGPLGLDRGMIHFSARSWRTNLSEFKGVFLQTFSMAVIAGVVIGALLFLTAPLLETYLDKPGLELVLRGFAFAIPLVTGLSVLVAATQVSRRMQYSVMAEDLGQPLANIVLVLLFFALGFGLTGVMIGAVGSFALAVLLAFYYIWRLYPGLWHIKAVRTVPTRRMFSFSLPSAFAGAFTLLTSWTSLLFIGFYMSAAAMGTFQAITQAAILFTITLRALNSVFAPMIAELYHQQNLGRLNELYKISTKWALYLSLPIYLTILFAAREGLLVIFGSAYVDGAVPLIIIATGQIINVATGSVGFILVMTSHQRIWMNISGLTLLLNLALNWLLIPRYGLNGAAVSYAVMITALYVGGLWQVRRTSELWPYDRRYLKVLLALAVAVVPLSVLRLTAIDSAAGYLLLVGLLAFGVFWGMLLLLGLDEEDRQFLSTIRSRTAKMAG